LDALLKRAEEFGKGLEGGFSLEFGAQYNANPWEMQREVEREAREERGEKEKAKEELARKEKAAARARKRFDYEEHDRKMLELERGASLVGMREIPWLPVGPWEGDMFGDKLRAAAIRWHPDKWSATFKNRLRREDIKGIMRRVLETSQRINELRNG